MSGCGREEKATCHGCCACGDTGARPGPVSGWRLVMLSGLLFLMPAVLAVIGAAAIGTSQERQFLGAAAGFLIGMGAAVRMGKRWLPSTSGESS